MTSAGAKTTPQAGSSAPHARAVASRTLTVFGATGGTGQQLVRLALEGGHVVTAVARDPARLATRHDRLAIRPADVLESDSLPALVGGADAVLSALGSTSRAPTTIYSAGVANILEAMRAANVRRCLALSAGPWRLDPRRPRSSGCRGLPTRRGSSSSQTQIPGRSFTPRVGFNEDPTSGRAMRRAWWSLTPRGSACSIRFLQRPGRNGWAVQERRARGQ